MKKLAGLAFLGLQAVAAGSATAQVMDLTIGSDMAAVDITQRQDVRGSLWSLGLARNSDEDSTMASLTYNVVGDIMANKSIRAGIGWKASYHNTFQSSFSLAVGGFARYELPTVQGLGFEGGVYYAPDVLATNDVERYRELTTRVTYDLHSRATVFLGWANEELRYEAGAEAREVEVVDGLVAGFSIAF